MVQMTTVSMNGSSKATMPSVTGSLVRTAEWAIGADPMPGNREVATLSFCSFLFFMGLLALTFVYIWKEGGLEWR
jgi:hypothetical protein